MTLPLFHPDLQPYLTALVPERPPELLAMEAYAEKTGFPIIGPACGHFCYLIARLVGARRVFELGSGYGYSTAWFARAVQENGGGEVYHVVWDPDLSSRARTHLDNLGYQDVLRYQVGEAVEALRNTPGPFDLIFNDIDKEGYPGSLPAIAEKLRAGGVLIVDNMFLGGRIFGESDHSPSVRGVRELTQLLTTDPGWISAIVPLRDGLLVAQKSGARPDTQLSAHHDG